ncbi:MAG: hypothetical protein IJ806_10765 [Ruminococcus sp.]|nr:hypothetical protein [Ruminococcus sp.]
MGKKGNSIMLTRDKFTFALVCWILYLVLTLAPALSLMVKMISFGLSVDTVVYILSYMSPIANAVWMMGREDQWLWIHIAAGIFGILVLAGILIGLLKLRKQPKKWLLFLTAGGQLLMLISEVYTIHTVSLGHSFSLSDIPFSFYAMLASFAFTVSALNNWDENRY